MPGTYSFLPEFSTSNFLSQLQFGTGAGIGIDAPADYWAQGANFHFGNNDVSLVPVALRAGQTITIDLDYGAGGIDDIDARCTIVSVSGNAVATISSSAGLDTGTTVNTDPRGTYTAAATGLYFIAVTHQTNVYVNGTFGFNDLGTDGGDFLLNLGLTGLSPVVLGTGGNDTVNLGLTELSYNALGGDDHIVASTNATTIDGGAGDDNLNGSVGSDILFGGDGFDSLFGNGANDVLVGGNSDDYARGGLGNDELYGGEDMDTLFGDEGNDTIAGENGIDTLFGGGNHDKLYGGDDNDFLMGGLGNDLLDGGDGIDKGNYTDAIGNVTVNLLLAGAQVTGMGTDTLVSIENLDGGNFSDTLTGNSNNNTLEGGAGNDRLLGNDGNDMLYGSAGTDTINGGAGGDFVSGGAELDHLTGGANGDTFYFGSVSDSTVATSDRIYDFSHAEGDFISLFSVNPGTLVFLGAGPFTGTAAEVRVIVAGAFQAVYVDNTADGVADMRILVQSATTLAAGDFSL